MLYFFANEECRKRFSVNPDKYLSNTSNLKNLHVSVLGGPFSGKTKQSKMLANQYQLVYLSAEHILTQLDKEKDQAQLKAQRPLYAEIVSVLRTGAYLSAKHIIRLFQEELEIQKDKRENGWVMDGFPKTMEEIKELQASNLAPRYVVFLKNGELYQAFNFV
jgi:adenylate kinase